MKQTISRYNFKYEDFKEHCNKKDRGGTGAYRHKKERCIDYIKQNVDALKIVSTRENMLGEPTGDRVYIMYKKCDARHKKNQIHIGIMPNRGVYDVNVENVEALNNSQMMNKLNAFSTKEGAKEWVKKKAEAHREPVIKNKTIHDLEEDIINAVETLETPELGKGGL